MPRAETSYRRSHKIKAASSSCKRNKERKSEDSRYSIGQKEGERQRYCTIKSKECRKDQEAIPDYRDVLSYACAKEKVVVNEKYPEQTVTIGKQSPVSLMSIWKAFGGNTRDLGSFGEETDKTTNLHQHLSRTSTQKLKTVSQITRDAITAHLKMASQDLKTASDRLRKPAFVCTAVDMSRKT
ncbi:hypothetical protein Tco_1462504 [Tanacetum coccineum]